jgi:hypothetical protein
MKTAGVEICKPTFCDIIFLTMTGTMVRSFFDMRSFIFTTFSWHVTLAPRLGFIPPGLTFRRLSSCLLLPGLSLALHTWV